MSRVSSFHPQSPALQLSQRNLNLNLRYFFFLRYVYQINDCPRNIKTSHDPRYCKRLKSTTNQQEIEIPSCSNLFIPKATPLNKENENLFCHFGKTKLHSDQRNYL